VSPPEDDVRAGAAVAPPAQPRSSAAEGEAIDVNVTAPTVQLLAWLAESPRSYPETLEAWKTSCPRLAVWEDALAGDLVRVERGRVSLTPAGRKLLQSPASPVGGEVEARDGPSPEGVHVASSPTWRVHTRRRREARACP
jgi:hypothetical protein